MPLDAAVSVTGRTWRLRAGDDRLAETLAQRLGVPEVVGRVMAARGIDLDGAEDFLKPTLRALLPDPLVLTDMDRAVDRMVRAIRGGEGIAVFGDYDVDGATSSALLLRFLAAVGCPGRLYIPDRQNEGYGPNGPALARLAGEGARVVVTVDCGTTAHEALAAGQAAGVDVVVVDHHEAEPALPPCAALVNPNRLDDDSGLGQLAAVGVTFLFVVALNRALREAGHYRDRPPPDLMAWLDLVALGTVCDVVPLQGLNRALVAQGLKVMRGRRNVGLAALADVAGVKEAPGTYHLGFLLGPRVNAGGRIGAADLGARLLLTEDPDEARTLAERLDGHNGERQAIEAQVLDEAIGAVEAAGAPEWLAVAVGRDWHPGVVGIVASRLKERYQVPAVVITVDGAGVAKGSGRSVRGVDLGAAVIAARQAGLLTSGGGHAMAAGLTGSADRLDDLVAFLRARIADQLGEAGLVREMEMDGHLALAAARPDLVNTLAALGPFGVGNPEPRFVFRDVRITRADVVGRGHVRCRLSDGQGAQIKAMAFRAADTPLGDLLRDRMGARVHILGHLRIDDWDARQSAQLFIDDAAPA